MKGRKGLPSLRDRRIAVNRSLDFYAAMSNKPDANAPRNIIAPKRFRKQKNKALETNLNHAIQQAIRSVKLVCLWRNNRGTAFFGDQRVRYGVGPNGAGDFIGYRILKITPDMVGMDIAQFVSLESKAPGELMDEDQRKFVEGVREDGGHAGMIDNIDDLHDFLNK